MNLAQRDLQHIWHPCAQMKDYETFQALEIKNASGSYIELSNGKKMIDAISSWWCKILGHGHPALKQALFEQAEKFEHVIFANTTHKTIVELAEKLAHFLPGLNKVMFASEGSSAVEIALKMSLHARQISGEKQRTRFMALANGYHGETCGALGMSDCAIFRQPYETLLPTPVLLQNLPYVVSTNDPLWDDCSSIWPQIETQLSPHKETLTAIILEPILQGAGGMRIYSQDFLQRLRHWSMQHNIHLIADEILTGFGRTGKALACNHANIIPDFLCLSKGLTGGWLPMSATLIQDKIYQLFYDDYSRGKSFLHSHTHSGNSLAAAVALACLNTLEQENIYSKIQETQKDLKQLMDEVATHTQRLQNIRHIGMVVAADLIVDDGNNQRLGYHVFQEAVKLGAYLRPLGNTIYWLPPLNIDKPTLHRLAEITATAINAVFSRNSR
jgi:adenosylmethionine-8-amino-7-oxononanoate aminotransferase